MYSKKYYEIQLETFTKMKEKCTNKVILEKINKVMSKYQHFIENYGAMKHSSDECHCSLCEMQG